MAGSIAVARCGIACNPTIIAASPETPNPLQLLLPAVTADGASPAEALVALNACSPAGMTLLHVAVGTGSVSVVQELAAWARQAGCCWEVDAHCAGSRVTPLHVAALLPNAAEMRAALTGELARTLGPLTSAACPLEPAAGQAQAPSWAARAARLLQAVVSAGLPFSHATPSRGPPTAVPAGMAPATSKLWGLVQACDGTTPEGLTEALAAAGPVTAAQALQSASSLCSEATSEPALKPGASTSEAAMLPEAELSVKGGLSDAAPLLAGE